MLVHVALRRVALTHFDFSRQLLCHVYCVGGQALVVLDQEASDPISVRTRGKDAEKVAAIARTRADHADGVGCSRVKVALDLGPHGGKPVA